MQTGDHVTIHGSDGELLSTGICKEVMIRQVVVVSHKRAINFSNTTYREIGGMRTAKVVTADEAEAAKKDLERQEAERQSAKEARDEAKRKADYDALPEPVKLARSLKWLCDCESESKIAKAPIELLRGIVAWAKENRLTTE